MASKVYSKELFTQQTIQIFKKLQLNFYLSLEIAIEI
jgi:hypothetical protein